VVLSAREGPSIEKERLAHPPRLEGCMSEATPKKESAEAKKARERREEQELQDKRNHQLVDAHKAVETLEGHLRTTRSTMKLCDALSSHSNGFYEEVNKLAKGKTLLEVTPLVVDQANDIIRDAKSIVKNDVYLDRIKEFVPAGNNPVYPDVLISIRSVRDSLERCREELVSGLDSLQAGLVKAKTVVGALEYFLDDDRGDENDRDFPSKDAVKEYVTGNISDSCFFWCPDNSEHYFDFFTLDQQTIQEYLAMRESDKGDKAETEEESDDSDEGNSSEGDQEEQTEEEDNGE
jgi:hypothetical protein